MPDARVRLGNGRPTPSFEPRKPSDLSWGTRLEVTVGLTASNSLSDRQLGSELGEFTREKGLPKSVSLLPTSILFSLP